MAFSKYEGKTDIIQSLDDQPNDVGGLTAAELKSKFDQFGAEFIEWLNSTHKNELDTLQLDITTHKAENASKHIKESGSNANGKYIKFDDGTQICYSPTVTMVYVGANTLRYTWTYPAIFIDTPAVIQTPEGSTANISNEGTRSTVRTTPAATSCLLDLINLAVSTFVSGNNMNTRAIAIGRWK